MNHLEDEGFVEQLLEDEELDMIEEDYEEDYNDEEEDENPSNHIVVATKEEGVTLMTEWLLTKADSINFTLLMDDEGVLKVYYRDCQPCYGELRTYGTNSTAPYVKKPSDLHHPFPDGNPIAVGSIFTNKNEWMDVALNPPTSPWFSVLKEFTIISNAAKSGIVITDTNIDPTIMVHMFRMMRESRTFNNSFQILKRIFPDEPEEILWVISTFIFFPLPEFYTTNSNDYANWAGNKPDINRIFNHNPMIITGGTFHDRWAYNRPDIDYIFGRNAMNIIGSIREVSIVGKYNYFKIEGLSKVVDLFKEWHKNAVVLG